MAAPLIHCYTVANGTFGAVSVNKPGSGSTAGPDGAKNPATGDLLVIVAGDDDTTATPQFSQSNAPTGFTFINTAGDATSDAHVGAFYRVVDGTEGASFSVNSELGADLWVICILLSGASGSTPLHLTGADVIDATPPIAITGVTTTTADCTALAVYAYDGGDDDGFATSGTGWTELAEHRSGVTANNASGGVSYRKMSGTGATGDCTITPTSSDGMAGFQFALAPGVTIHSGAVAFAGAGTLVPAGVKRVVGAVAVSGAGTAALAGVKRVAGTLAVSGAGGLTLLAVPTAEGYGGFSHWLGGRPLVGFPNGTFDYWLGGFPLINVPKSASQVLDALVAFTGAGTAAASGVLRAEGAVAASGAGVASFGAVAQALGALTASGAGTYSLAGALRADATLATSGVATAALAAALQAYATATFTGTGSEALAGLLRAEGALAASGAATFAALGGQTFTADLSFAGAGTLALAALRLASASLALSGAGTVALNGNVTANGALTALGAGSFVPMGALLATGALAPSGMATLALEAFTSGVQLAEITFAGSGTVSLAALLRAEGALATSGVGTLSLEAVLTAAVAAAFAGTGTLTLAGVFRTDAILASAGFGTAAFSSALIAAGLLNPSGTATFALDGLVAGVQDGQITFSGALTLSLAALIAAQGALTLAGSGVVDFLAGKINPATFTATGTAAAMFDGRRYTEGAAGWAGSGVWSGDGDGIFAGAWSGSGNATATLSPTAQYAAQLALTGLLNQILTGELVEFDVDRVLRGVSRSGNIFSGSSLSRYTHLGVSRSSGSLS